MRCVEQFEARSVGKSDKLSCDALIVISIRER